MPSAPTQRKPSTRNGLTSSAKPRPASPRLSQSQAFAVMQNAPTNIILADPELRITYLNPSSEKTLKQIEHLLPCKVDEIIGKSVSVLVPPGPISLRYAFRKTGRRRGIGTLFVGAQAAGSAELPKTWPVVAVTGGLTCGRAGSSAVGDAYTPPFPFTGTLRRVVVQLGDDGQRDSSAEARAAFAAVTQSYAAAARAADGALVAVGQGWQAAWSADRALPLYGEDGFHPSSLGTYVAALMFVAHVTGSMPPAPEAGAYGVTRERLRGVHDAVARAREASQRIARNVARIDPRAVSSGGVRLEAIDSAACAARSTSVRFCTSMYPSGSMAGAFAQTAARRCGIVASHRSNPGASKSGRAAIDTMTCASRSSSAH